MADMGAFCKCVYGGIKYARSSDVVPPDGRPLRCLEKCKGKFDDVSDTLIDEFRMMLHTMKPFALMPLFWYINSNSFSMGYNQCEAMAGAKSAFGVRALPSVPMAAPDPFASSSARRRRLKLRPQAPPSVLLTPPLGVLDRASSPQCLQMQNFNAIAIIGGIPIFDKFIYPRLKLTWPAKIGWGLICTGLVFILFAINQLFIDKWGYYQSEDSASYTFRDEYQESKPRLSVWLQALPFALTGIGEILANVTVMELACECCSPPALERIVLKDIRRPQTRSTVVDHPVGPPR